MPTSSGSATREEPRWQRLCQRVSIVERKKTPLHRTRRRHFHRKLTPLMSTTNLCSPSVDATETGGDTAAVFSRRLLLGSPSGAGDRLEIYPAAAKTHAIAPATGLPGETRDTGQPRRQTMRVNVSAKDLLQFGRA